MAKDIVDVWMQIMTPKMAAEPWQASLQRWTGRSQNDALPTLEGTLAAMDGAGVTAGIISAWVGPRGVLISNEETAENAAQSGGRLKPVLSVNLDTPMEAVRDIRDGAKNGFIGVRALPWLWGLPPNDRRFYPVYTACVEEGLPFCTQIGHTCPLRSSDVGRPIPYLEDVLLDFPELIVVCGHVGFPWVNELVTLLFKFPNFYIDTSAYTLARLPPDFVHVMKTAGKDRVMFGTNWPMIAPAHALKGLDQLALDDETRTAFLSGTARRVFNLS